MNTDISALHKQLQLDIEKVEQGNHDIALLDSIRSNFVEMLELIKLFLISERDTYYGYFMMNMTYEVDFYTNTIAGIKLNSFPPVFLSNPLLLCKYNIKEIIYIFCHEIDHILLNHPAEMLKVSESDYKEFNLAADASVNDRINHEITTQKRKFLKQPNNIITSGVLKEMYGLKNINKLENYIYYFNLIVKDKDKDKGNKDNNANSNSQGSCENGEIITAQNCGEVKDHDWEAGNDYEEASSVVKEFVNSADEMMNNETRGLMPAYYITQVKKINEPVKINWKQLLKKYIGTISASKVSTRMKLNRRQPLRFDLSGSKADKVLKIVCAIDTSGSMKDEDISKVLNEILDIVAKRKHEITVIECDAKINKVYKVKSTLDIQNKVKGRGGTRFSPVIEYINNNKYYRDALLIYFTDGGGEQKIPKPLTYRNLWVVFGGEKFLSVSQPYGTVVAI